MRGAQQEAHKDKFGNSRFEPVFEEYVHLGPDKHEGDGAGDTKEDPAKPVQGDHIKGGCDDEDRKRVTIDGE